MRKKNQLAPAEIPILRWIVFLLLGSTTLIITVNSYDSGMAKTPLLALLAGLLIAAYVSLVIRAGELRYRPSVADIPVLVFLLLIIASLSYSESPMGSFHALELWIPFVACFFAGTQVFWNQDAVKKLTWTLAIISSAVVVIGLAQFFFSGELALNFFIGTDRRVTSTLTNSTYLSGYIVLLFPFLLAYAMSEPRGSRMRWFLITIILGLAFLLFATSTRSSIAAFLVSLLALIVLSNKARSKTIALSAIAFLIVVVAVLLTPRLAERIEGSFRDDPSSTFARRTYFWKAGYNAWKAAPLFGHGIGSYEEVMREYRPPEYWVVGSEDLVPHAHNEIIETAVDLGGIGAAAYLMILGVVLFHGIWSPREEKKREKWLRIGLCCSVLAILVDNLTNLSLRVAPVGATAWLFLGVLASHLSRETPAKVIQLRVARWLTILPVGGWAILAVLYGVQLWPGFLADSHLIQGSLAVADGKIPKAISEYRTAATLDPSNLLARSNYALLLLEGGHYAEALEQAEKLQKLSPNYPRLNLIQASALVSLKRYPEALDRIEKEITFRNHPEAYYYQAAAHMGLRDSAGEIQSLEQLLLADLRGKLDFELTSVSRRLMAVATKEEDLARLAGVYRQLSGAFPGDTSVALTLSILNGRLDSTHRGRGE